MEIARKEKMPGRESLLSRIDAIRLFAIQQSNSEAFSSAVFGFNESLKARYTRDELWAVPAWHKLTGSSQQAEYAFNEKVPEITELIEEFVTSWEEVYK